RKRRGAALPAAVQARLRLAMLSGELLRLQVYLKRPMVRVYFIATSFRVAEFPLQSRNVTCLTVKY
ncbi:MAG TPA: hypothetical protein VGO57_08095, partial [Verrucomicrobiae bacterium]